MPKTVEELNKDLLDIIDNLKSQPQGTIKTTTFPKMHGVEASEKAAKQYATTTLSSFKSVLKEKFERLGVQEQIAPALLAGIASRESNMGMQLQPVSSIY